MTGSITRTRRAALLGAAAALSVPALSACSTGQIAETANKEASVYGVSAQSADGSVLIRGLAVAYRDVQGYPAGGAAPLEVSLFNDTAAPISVRITSTAPAAGAADPTVIFARGVALAGAEPGPSASATGVPAEAEPSGTPEPASPATPGAAGEPTPGSDGGPAPQASSAGSGVSPQPTRQAGPAPAARRPAIITIPALSSSIFLPDGEQQLQLTGLSGALTSGMSVNLVFEFSNGAPPLVVQAPVGVPLEPAPRGSAHNEGNDGGVEPGTGGQHG